MSRYFLRNCGGKIEMYSATLGAFIVTRECLSHHCERNAAISTACRRHTIDCFVTLFLAMTLGWGQMIGCFVFPFLAMMRGVCDGGKKNGKETPPALRATSPCQWRLWKESLAVFEPPPERGGGTECRRGWEALKTEGLPPT